MGTDMLTRRNVLLSSLIALAPIRTRGESGVGPRIGALFPTSPGGVGSESFFEGLRQLGYVDGTNIHIKTRFAAGKLEQLPSLAAEILQENVSLVAVQGAVTVRAVQQVTRNLPIIFFVVLDPAADGLVASNERPGGNVTGVTSFDPSQAKAQLQVLKQTVPRLERITLLSDAGVPDLLDASNREAAEALGLVLHIIRLRGPSPDLDAVFAKIQAERSQAVLGVEVPVVGVMARKIIAAATALKLPTLFPGDWSALGPMIAYGTSLAESARKMSGMVDRVLKGARPADMPIEFASTHKLTINLKIARDLGLTIPPELVSRADKVIE